MIKEILAVLLCLVAAYYDKKTLRIPNTLTFGSLFLGLCLSSSWEEFGFKILGIVFLFFFGMFRFMGMGDLKLWMALCAILGFLDSAYAIGIGAFLLILHGLLQDPKETLQIIKLTFSQFIYIKKVQPFEQKEYAFAPYILCGLILLLLFYHGKGVIF